MTTVDLLVVGSGTGMAAALAAHEAGLRVLIVEKSSYVGGSTARSGGALWLPGSQVMRDDGAADSTQRAQAYLDAVVDGTASEERSTAFLQHVAPTVDMLRRTTPMKLFWAREYSDYHPELPGGSAAGRTCECRPLNTSILGEYLPRLRPGVMEATIPMPTTGADYRWLNLDARVPRKGLPHHGQTSGPRRRVDCCWAVATRRAGRHWPQDCSPVCFAPASPSGRTRLWSGSPMTELESPAPSSSHGGNDFTITARRGVVLAAGGFDHHMDMRWKFQSESLGANQSLGADTNTGDAIRLAQDAGRGHRPDGPVVVVPGRRTAARQGARGDAGRALAAGLADRRPERRPVRQRVERLHVVRSASAAIWNGRAIRIESMWIVFDQKYRNSYVFAAELFPRMAIPRGMV